MLRTHLGQQCLDAILRPHGLTRHHLVTRHEALGISSEIDVDAVSVNALDESREQFALPVLVFLDDLLTLSLPHLLHDDLFGCLRRDAAELDRFHRHFDVTTRLRLLVDIDGIHQAQLAIRYFQLGRVVLENQPATKRVVVAGLPVDRHPNVDIVAVLSARCRRKCGFDSLEYDLLFDALLVRHGVDNHQDLFAHYL